MIREVPRYMFIGDAIRLLTPDASFIVEGEEITWNSPDITQPTTEEIDAVIDGLVSEVPVTLLRKERNILLSATDWWVLPDRTPTQEQLDYRQALRDITETYSSLDDVVWPVKP